jgi:predicted  nucleic acid-binding Zn-ribbon protein
MFEKLDQILKEQKRIMAAIDDLKNSVAALGTSISSELAAISAKLSNPETSDADIEAVVSQIDALKTQVDTETATLAGTSAAAPTPTS